MILKNKKVEEKISSTLYDLTHLEINTIIKDEMTATKAPSSPRLLLHELAIKYHFKLIDLGEIYMKFEVCQGIDYKKLFRNQMNKSGSGYDSFMELRDQARITHEQLRKDKLIIPRKEERVSADIKMLQRIEIISNDIMNILKMNDTLKIHTAKDHVSYKFDDPEMVVKFRIMQSRKAEHFELNLDLRQLLVIKKANDIGTEKVVMQTIIGMDGDVTTRISKTFADQPVAFINDIHNEAIRISVDFWENLVSIVVKLGEKLINSLLGKS